MLERRARAWLAVAFLLVVAVTTAVSWHIGRSNGRSSDASADRLFPSRLAASQAFDITDVVRAQAWAAKPERLVFDATVRDSGQQQNLFVLCDHGRISVDLGGGVASTSCSGSVTELLGNLPHRGRHVRVFVDQPQSSPWGFAVYEPAR